ncbi:MAG: MoxR family ATPase [Acidobacteriota bacterium]|nr:MoxR family ATPase [Blastocatellia bacterium]MDW8238161.1 MoxR family ATPase [Acidobacteriota bacterium]
MTTHVHEITEHIRHELHKVIVGQEHVIDQILVALFAEGHVLIEGVPGIAKTLLVKVLARVLGLRFSRIQFTPDLMPADITGTNVFNMATGSFSLRNGPVFTDLLLADEINRTPPKTQAALLEAMEERQVTIDGSSYPLPPLFMVFATQNPIEYEGTYPLPEAQLDRFLLKISMPYPTAEQEQQVVLRWHSGFHTLHLDEVPLNPLNGEAVIQECRRTVRAVTVEDGIMHYLVSIVRRTREMIQIGWGASPRASIALLLCSKALAAMRGRSFVLPDDVKEMTKPVLRHRIVLRPEAQIDGLSPDDVLDEVIHHVEVPR